MFKSIDEFLKGLPVNAVLRERVSQMYADIERLTEKNSALQKENTELLEANKGLVNELSEIKATADNFVPAHGLKVKKIPGGGYDETVAYCFHCHSPLSAPHKTKKLECSKCGYKSPIQERHFQTVVAELKGEPLPDWFKFK